MTVGDQNLLLQLPPENLPCRFAPRSRRGGKGGTTSRLRLESEKLEAIREGVQSISHTITNDVRFKCLVSIPLRWSVGVATIYTPGNIRLRARPYSLADIIL